MKAWYVAKTKPAKERMVETYLTEIWDIEVFLPIIRCPSGKKGGSEPLFPTYIFCLADPWSDSWPAIRWAPGLSYFLNAGQELVPVNNELITHLKQQVSWWNGGGYVPSFTSGEQLKVIGGPFYGLEAIFQRYLPAKQRCQVLLEILGQQARVEIPLEVLRGVSPFQGLALAA